MLMTSISPTFEPSPLSKHRCPRFAAPPNHRSAAPVRPRRCSNGRSRSSRLKDQALDLFTSGNGGFIDRDLYVFCSGPDGMLTAHPCFMGVNLFSDVDTRLVGCGHLSGLLMRC